MISQAERFFKRFEGLDRGHGEYLLAPETTPDSRGKIQGGGNTVHEPPTITHWVDHLSGELQLGIVPIRDDATCVFGAIDIDVYDKFDLTALASNVAALELPLIVCRTKSGGAHLYLFTSEPCPAELVRGKLMEWAIVLGHSGVEVYPKQTRLAGPNDYGNWINMPYQNADMTDRYAITNLGVELTADQFLDYAETIQISCDDLKALTTPENEKLKDVLEQAPPCLQTLAMRGFGEGSRNNALFNIGVYLRKRFGEDMWEDKLDGYNQRFMEPPLGHKEVAAVTKSVKRKTYEYKCTDNPIAPVCNRQICLTRKYGIATGDSDPGVVFGPLLKIATSPPIWIWDVNGARIELDTNDLKDQGRFHTKCIEILNIWPNFVKAKDWATVVREKLERVEVVDVPPDAKPEGLMWAYLQDYCTSSVKAKTKDELLQFKPWTDQGRIYFSGAHFKKYLEQTHRMKIDVRQIWSWLRNRNAQHHQFNIKGKGINVWSVEVFQSQSEPFPVPRLKDNQGEM